MLYVRCLLSWLNRSTEFFLLWSHKGPLHLPDSTLTHQSCNHRQAYACKSFNTNCCDCISQVWTSFQSSTCWSDTINLIIRARAAEITLRNYLVKHTNKQIKLQ